MYELYNYVIFIEFGVLLFFLNFKIIYLVVILLFFF